MKWYDVFWFYENKANLRDLIAAAGLVTLFGQRDFETAWMIVKNNHLQMKIISYQINPAEMVYIIHLSWNDSITKSMTFHSSLIISLSVRLTSYISNERIWPRS